MAINLEKILPGDGAQNVADKIYNNDKKVLDALESIDLSALTANGGYRGSAKDLSNGILKINKELYGEAYEDISPGWVVGYIKTDGTEDNTSTTYRKSKFIKVQPGQKYIVYVAGSENVLLISGYSSNTQSSFISSEINIKGNTTPSILKQYRITVPQTINYIRVTCNSSVTSEAIIGLIDSNSGGGGIGLVERVNTLEEQTSDLGLINDTLFGGGGVIEDLTNQLAPWITGHINTSGQLVTGSTYQVSSFVQVQPGKRYIIKCYGSVNVLLISGYSSNNQNSFVVSNMNILGNGIIGKPTVVIPNGVNFVRLCNNSPGLPTSNVYLKEVDSLVEKGLVERVDVLEENGGGNTNFEFRIKRGAIFSVMADDALKTDPLALSIANRFSVPLSFAIQTNNISNNGVQFYKDAYKNGSSILSHTVTHVASESEIINSKLTLKNYGFPTNGYISPGGGTNASLLPVLDRYYGYANSLPNISSIIPLDSSFVEKFDKNVNPLKMTRIGLDAWNTNIKDCSKIFEMIDFAIENNLLVLMYIHAMPSTYKHNDGTSVLTEANMDAICAYLANKRDNYYCKVLNVDQAVKDYYSYKDFE